MVRTLVLLLCALPLAAQLTPEREEWLAEFRHQRKQVLSLAEATPEGEFGWRPAAGIRSFSEVYMHIAAANLMLLSRVGVAAPKDFPDPTKFSAIRAFENSVTAKKEVLQWLAQSFDAVETAYPKAGLDKLVPLFGNQKRTVRGVYLRLLIHVNEHMGQAVAYARMNGVVPPWAQK